MKNDGNEAKNEEGWWDREWEKVRRGDEEAAERTQGEGQVNHRVHKANGTLWRKRDCRHMKS